MKNYNENEFSDVGVPTINADTGELEGETKKNQNRAWAEFRDWWIAVWKEKRGFEPEIGLVRDKAVFHQQRKLRTLDEMKKIVMFYFGLDKSHEHSSLSACFSADTLNQYKKGLLIPKTIKIGQHG